MIDAWHRIRCPESGQGRPRSRTGRDEIESQKREVEKAQKEKTDLLAKVGDRLTWSIRLFEAIYRLADLGFHAERLRLPVSSRPSAGEAAAAPAGGEVPEAGGEEPAESSASGPTSNA